MTATSTAEPARGGFSAAAWPFVILFALSVFSRIADQLGIDGFLTRVARVWREFTHALWSDLFALLPEAWRLDPTENQFDGLTLSAMFIGAVAAAPLVALVAKARGQVPTSKRSALGPSTQAFLFVACLIAMIVVFSAPYARGYGDYTAESLARFWTHDEDQRPAAIFFALILVVITVVGLVGCFVFVRTQARGKNPGLLSYSAVASFASFAPLALLDPAAGDPGARDARARMQTEALEQLNAAQGQAPSYEASFAQIGENLSQLGATYYFLVFVFGLGIILLARLNPMALPRMIAGAAVLVLANMVVEALGPVWGYFDGVLERVGG